jgi:hypothetical protein
MQGGFIMKSVVRGAGSVPAALAVLLAISGCGAVTGGGDAGLNLPAADSGPSGAALDGGTTMVAERWPACDPSAASQKISFVHVNDLHAAYVPEITGILPVSRLRGYYEKAKRENPYTLFTNGGDDHEKGSVIEQLSGGESTRELIMAMQFDVRVLGNHDFGWSADRLLEHTWDPYATVLSSNVKFTGYQALYSAREFQAIQVGCVKIGFFGMTPKPWNELDEEFAGDFYPQFESDHDYVSVAKRIVEAHRGEVNLMVMVSHLGFDTDKAISAAVPGIDVVLGGHSHTATWTADTTTPAIIVQSGSMGQWAGRLDLDYDLNAGKIAAGRWELSWNIQGVLPVSEAFQKKAGEITAPYFQTAYSTIGHVYKARDKREFAYIAAVRMKEILNADAVVIENSTIWQGLGAGGLSNQTLHDLFKVEREPAGTSGFNSFYSVEMEGSSLEIIKNCGNKGLTIVAPGTIDAGDRYVVLMQKRPALHPEKYFPAGVEYKSAAQGSEAWKLLSLCVARRTEHCLHFDEDQFLVNCEPPR